MVSAGKRAKIERGMNFAELYLVRINIPVVQ